MQKNQVFFPLVITPKDIADELQFINVGFKHYLTFNIYAIAVVKHSCNAVVYKINS